MNFDQPCPPTKEIDIFLPLMIQHFLPPLGIPVIIPWTCWTSSKDDVQRDYPATAPLNLGAMGYVGRVPGSTETHNGTE